MSTPATLSSVSAPADPWCLLLPPVSQPRAVLDGSPPQLGGWVLGENHVWFSRLVTMASVCHVPLEGVALDLCTSEPSLLALGGGLVDGCLVQTMSGFRQTAMVLGRHVPPEGVILGYIHASAVGVAFRCLAGEVVLVFVLPTAASSTLHHHGLLEL
jgi:hypothetical protein